MISEALLAVLSDMRALPSGFVTALGRELTYVCLPKLHYLLESPGIARSAFFLEKGLVIGYSYYKGRRVVTSLWSDGEIIFSPMSFYSQVPASESIQLMEDSDLVCISHEGLLRLRQDRDLCQLIAGRYVEKYRQRVLELQSDDTRARYENLLQRHRGIELRIPQEIISRDQPAGVEQAEEEVEVVDIFS